MVWLELYADLCVDLRVELVLDQIQELVLSCLLPGMPVSVPPVLKEKQSYMRTLGTYCSKSWWHKGGIIKQHPDLVKKVLYANYNWDGFFRLLDRLSVLSIIFTLRIYW